MAPFDTPTTSLPNSPALDPAPRHQDVYRLDRIEQTIDHFTTSLANQLAGMNLPEHDELRITAGLLLDLARHPIAAIATKRRAVVERGQ